MILSLFAGNDKHVSIYHHDQTYTIVHSAIYPTDHRFSERRREETVQINPQLQQVLRFVMQGAIPSNPYVFNAKC